MSSPRFLERLLDGADVEWVPLNQLVMTITAPSKAKKSDYQEHGKNPIVDQGATFISGFANELFEPVVTDEYVIFGDHSEHIKYVDFAFVQGADGLKILKPRTDLAKYIYHSFLNFYQKELNYKRHWSKAKETLIPIPCPDDPEKSLAIQGKIVRMLDSFTELTAELTAELDQRKKQYNYYRDQLLTFDEGEVEWKPLSQLVDTVTPPSKVKKETYRRSGKTPIVDQGANFIAGYTDEDFEVVEQGNYVIFGDHSEHLKYVDFAFIQGADGLKILKPKSQIPKFIFYAMQTHYKKEGNYKRHWSKAKETPIPIPFPNDLEKSIKEQARIVAILDKFDTLTSSITEGLPREIELREKQYAYYRDQLLSFPKPQDKAA